VARRGPETALATVPLFEGLPPRHLRKLRDLCKVVDYMPGHSVVKEGDAGDSFYVIVSGQAKVTSKGRSIRSIRPGDHFGEIALLDGGERTASVMTETPMRLLEIKRNAFTKLVQAEPLIAVGLLKGIARMIRQTERPIAG
jgi:CRP/FNR family transcriptional regulator, cyclic AMP receptor protein